MLYRKARPIRPKIKYNIWYELIYPDHILEERRSIGDGIMFRRKNVKKKNNKEWCNKEKVKDKDRYSYLENLSGTFHLSEDILLGSGMITITGSKKLRIENYKGIITYAEENIVLQMPEGKLEILGNKLNIDYCTDVELHVTGIIKQMEFLC